VHHRQKRRDLYHFLDQEIDKGRQVYLVCPAIEDTPDGGLNAVKTYYEDIAKALLPDAGGVDARQAQAQGEGRCHGGFQGRAAGRTGVHHSH